MKHWYTKITFIFLAAFVLSEVSVAKAAATNDEAKAWTFRVMLDDRPIGYHRVNINKEANRKTVHTQASFDVRILFIPVYSYEHETRELWEDGCLVDINSATDDNGENYYIKTRQQSQQLSLETQDGSTTLGGCVRTFAYWDVDLLQDERLLNTQTGKYEAVSVTDMGTGLLTIDDDQVEARHFRLVCEDMTIDLWYTREMHWLALESVTESGAVLRYLPERRADYAGGTQS